MTTAEATPELDIVDHTDTAFLGHPKGLAYLAFTEAWERFSYYGMQTLLILYMTKVLLWPGHVENIILFEQFRHLFGDLDRGALASAIFGTYTALVYFTPILGGLLADRVLGKRRAVLIGTITMSIGHFLMAFESSFLFALLCLVIGCGLIKGNIASQVGALYKPEDLRRGDAFQIFYLGINISVIISPFVIGTLGQKVGWHWGFGAAGVGMLIGTIIYIAGQKYLPKEHFDAQKTGAQKAPREPFTKSDYLSLAAVLLLIPIMAIAVVPNQEIFNAYLVWGDKQFDLMIHDLNLVFWHIHNFAIPSGWLIALDATVSTSFLFIVAVFYRWYGKRWQEPDEMTKIIIGAAFSIGGMLCLYMAAATTPDGEKVSLFWPVMFHVVNSIGFAHLLPISLSLFARLAPKQINATVIGLYYISFVIGNSLVGWLGGLYGKMPTTHFWLLHAGFAATGCVAFILFKIFLAGKLMGHTAPKAAEPQAAE
ncbi:peptide MFS transporter [Kordiimonas marina]|uniref:peptide MFS transporter n=1 Tax=Kordiimonas marina TaxID=2872312 RepID=UPI001FF2BD46|nr:peptide MFS transporter [Kordiimonas marina]MCJ9429636.1 peptide MFS transporter [Kordiimonas marina]